MQTVCATGKNILQALVTKRRMVWDLIHDTKEKSKA